MHGGVCGSAEVDRYTVVHGGVQRCTEVCGEVCVGGTEVCRGAQIYVEVHGGVRSTWRGVWRCKEVDRGVCGGGQRVYRGMQRTV